MDSEYDKKYKELLQVYEALPPIVKSQSIFNIAGYPHYENVCSNILAFYLNPYNEHGLGNLFLSSLMNLVNGNESSPKTIQVSREVFTNGGGRLDIVIETDKQLIGIENKIFHHLNNDLADYSTSIDNWAEPKQLAATKIILSIREEEASHGFVSITYDKLWAKIRERLGAHVTTVSQKWLLYLADFMSAIDDVHGGNMEINTNDQFFIDNEEKVNALINDRNKFIEKLNDRVGKLQGDPDLEIGKLKGCISQWIYANSCLVHDFELSGRSIAFDLYISPKGWELQLFGRNNDSRAYLSQLMSTPPLTGKGGEPKDNRFICKSYDLPEQLGEEESGSQSLLRLKYFE